MQRSAGHRDAPLSAMSDDIRDLLAASARVGGTRGNRGTRPQCQGLDGLDRLLLGIMHRRRGRRSISRMANESILDSWRTYDEKVYSIPRVDSNSSLP